MVIVPSQGLKLDALIRRGLTKMKIWNVIVFIDPQIKSAHSGCQYQDIGIMKFQAKNRIWNNIFSSQKEII